MTKLNKEKTIYALKNLTENITDDLQQINKSFKDFYETSYKSKMSHLTLP